MLERRIVPRIRTDLVRKMVLLSGPRQSGKTTIVRALARELEGLYLDWDHPADRRAIQKMDSIWHPGSGRSTNCTSTGGGADF